jgi:hypothetical protein
MNDKLTIEEFLEKKYLFAFRAWQRYQSYDWERDIKAGVELIMLRDGYCGCAGAIRIVKKVDGNVAYLVPPDLLETENESHTAILTRYVVRDGIPIYFTDVCYIVTDEYRMKRAEMCSYADRELLKQNVTGLSR